MNEAVEAIKAFRLDCIYATARARLAGSAKQSVQC